MLQLDGADDGLRERVRSARVSVGEEALVDLRRRLQDVRWPTRETVEDWSQGVPLGRMKAFNDYWLNTYDWRRCEAMLNSWCPHVTTLDGLEIAFFHIRSPETDALPMIMTHGWPGSILEFNRVVGPLTDPVSHGGDAGDAFHLVLPCLPGFGFSAQPESAGWTVGRIATAWAELMDRLGYGRWVAQGGDWGAMVTSHLAAAAPSGCVAVHLNTVDIASDSVDDHDNGPDAQRARAKAERYAAEEIGYVKEQATRPQTLGYALADSPTGQAAWIYEKYKGWMDPSREPEDAFGFNAMIDNIMLYWLTDSAASSARLYWESLADGALSSPVELPVAVTLFLDDVTYTPRHRAERLLRNIISWNEVETGGHLAAFERPDLFTPEVCQAFRTFRTGY
ncbi:epoxide hydrolase family protein [Novosphingopyxis sp.]|uniref:epoxide hydrolase family protein n=1 Tax=Novosphingopyxis sp. TaxID=2709690 RepID=UPI003B5C0931